MGCPWKLRRWNKRRCRYDNALGVTEGFDIRDLKDVKTLLDGLAR
jgi:hypothetical protein